MKNPEIKKNLESRGKILIQKIPNHGVLPKIPGIFKKYRKNPDGQNIVKTQIFFGIIKSQSRYPGFRDFLKVLRSRSRSPGLWDFQDYFGIFKSRSRSPGFQDFRDFSNQPKIEIPIPNPRDRDSGSHKKSHPEAISAHNLNFYCEPNS